MLTMCSLVYLLLLLSTGFANLANASTLSIGPTDAALVFSTGWKKSKSTDGKEFMVTENLGKALQINLPQNVTSLGYVGFTRKAGASYGVCVDCDVGTTVTLQTFQANTKNGASDTLPTELFSMNLDPTVLHTIGLYNFPDPRFDQSGSLTFVSLRLNFDGPTPSSTSSTSTQTNATENDGDETSTTSGAPEPSSTETAEIDEEDATPSATTASATATPTSESEDDNDDTSSGTATATSAAAEATSDDAEDDDKETTTATSAEPTSTSDDSDDEVSSSSTSPEPTSTSDDNDDDEATGTATSASVEPTSTSDTDDQENDDANSEASDGQRTGSTSSSAAGAQATDSNGKPVSGQSQGGDDSTDGATTTTHEPMSKALIAGIVILCVFAVIAILVAVFFYLRTRRRERSDIEHNAGMVSVGNITMESAPERPVNPFADAANVPLEFPMNSAMMPQRVIDFSSSRHPQSSRTSSFGNVAPTAPYSPMRTSWINHPRP